MYSEYFHKVFSALGIILEWVEVNWINYEDFIEYILIQ